MPVSVFSWSPQGLLNGLSDKAAVDITWWGEATSDSFLHGRNSNFSSLEQLLTLDLDLLPLPAIILPAEPSADFVNTSSTVLISHTTLL